MKYTLALLFLIIFCSCDSLKIKQDDVTIFIEDKVAYNNNYVTIKITNNSESDYYFLIDNKSIDKSFKIFDLQLRSYNLVLSDNNNKYLHIKVVDYDCPQLHTSHAENASGMIKIRSGSNKRFKMFFTNMMTNGDACWYGYDSLNSKQKYNISFIYYKPSIYSEYIKDSLGQQGFKLYDKALESNKIPFNFTD